MKIVLNECYGGFGLSYEAKALYLLAKGQTPYFYADVSSYNDYKKIPRYQLVSLKDIPKLNHVLFIYCTSTYQGDVIDDYPKDVISDTALERTDPDLVSVVEVMGSKAASGRYAHLVVEELPDGSLYKIDEYDGIESLITQDDDDWLIARDHDTDPSNKQHIENLWATIKPSPDYYDPDLMFRYDK